MDPLSITASVAGLLSLAGAIISKGFNLYSKCKNRDDINVLLTEVSTFSGLLVGIKSFHEDSAQQNNIQGPSQHGLSGLHPGQPGYPPRLVVRQPHRKSIEPFLRDAIKECGDVLQQIVDLLEELSKKNTLLLAMNRNFLTDEATKLTSKLERYKTFFVLSLQLNGSSQQEEVSRITSIMKEQLNEIRSAQSHLEQKFEAESESKKRTSIVEWLGNATTAAHSDALSSRHLDSGNWLLADSEFTDWMLAEHSSFLWLSGIAGSGKTVLVSTVIDCLQKVSASGHELGLAYHYCGATDASGISLERLLGNLLSQLLQQFELYGTKAETELFSRLNDMRIRSKYPSLGDLKEALFDVAKCFSKTFIVIDALDEFPHHHRFLDFLDTIASIDGNFKILVSSRRGDDLAERLSFFCRINMDHEVINHDIEQYVRARVSTLQWHNVPAIEDIIQELTLRADGMFLWVECQLNHLERIRKAITKDTLRALPRGLGHTYESILSKLEDEDKDLAIEILRFVMFSQRGLNLPEIVEAIAVDPDIRNLEQLKKNKLRNEDDVFEICGSLIRRSNSTGQLMLAHHSVREFLSSPVLESGQPNPYFIKSDDSPTKLALSCLTYLNFQDFSHLSVPTPHDPEPDADTSAFYQLIAQNPFFSYAACHWCDHASKARDEDLDRLLLLVDKLFDDKYGNFGFWSWFLRDTYGKFRIPSDLQPIHVYAIFGLHRMASKFAFSDEHFKAQTSDGRTPLHLALDNGNDDVVQFLLKQTPFNNMVQSPLKQSFLNIEDKFGRYPLHTAIESGNKFAVDLLLEAGANVNTVSAEGTTAVSIAVENKWIAILPQILKRANPSHSLPDGRTALHLVAQLGHLKSIKYFLQKLPMRELHDHLNKKDHNGWTALHYAVHHGHSDIAGYLLEEGAIPSGDYYGWTPAHAGIRRQDLASLELILKNEKWVSPAHAPNAMRSLPNIMGSRLRNREDLQRKYGNAAPEQLAGAELQTYAVPSLLSLATSENFFEGVECVLKYEQPTPEITFHLLERSTKLDDLKIFSLLLSRASVTSFFAVLQWVVNNDRLDVQSEVRTRINKLPDTDYRYILQRATHFGLDTPGLTLQRAAQYAQETPELAFLLTNVPRTHLHLLNEAFIQAVKSNRFNIAKALFASGASIAAEDESGATALDHVIQQRKHEAVDFLIECDAVHSADKEKKNEALRNIIAMCLTKEETVRSSDKWLHLARLLCDNGADIHIVDRSGRSNLHLAVEAQNRQMIEFTLENGLGPDLVDKSGRTPVDIAVQLADLDLLELLIRPLSSADPEVIVDVLGRTLSVAAAEENLQFLELLIQLRKAISSGHPEYRDTTLTSSLCYALQASTERGYDGHVALLIKTGADASGRNSEGFTPLHLAAKNNHASLIGVFLQHGADIESKTDTGSTALHLAIQNGSKSSVETLLSLCATIDESAIHLAEEISQTSLDILFQDTSQLIAEALKSMDNTNGAERIRAAKAATLAQALEDDQPQMAWAVIKSDPSLITTTNTLGETVLHIAAKQDFDLARRILRNDASKSIQDNQTSNGKTALLFATMAGQWLLVNDFLGQGAKVDSALAWAKENQRHGWVDKFEKYCSSP